MALSFALAFPLPKPSPSASARRPRSKPTTPPSASTTPPAVLAIDVGTSGTKAGLYALSSGLALCPPEFSPHSTSLSAACRTQNTHAWYSSTVAAVRSLPVPSVACVACLAVTGAMQNLSLFAPRGGEAVLGDGTALLYSDARAAASAAALGERLGERVGAEDILAKILHLQECGLRPEDGALALGSADAVVFRLCGARVTDGTNLSTTGLGDTFERLERAGMGAWRMCMPAVGSGVVGTVSPEAAAELGVLAGLDVVHAGGDAAATSFGAQCIDVRAGAYVYVGTSGWVGRTVFSGKRESAERQAAGVFYLAHPLGEEFALEIASMSAAGACLIWAAEMLCGGSVEELMKLAEGADAGEKSAVVFAPWLTGRRCPDPSSDAVAGFSGITSQTCKGDLARAVVEGVCFGLRSCLDLISSEGDDRPLTFVGGGAQSTYFATSLSKALGRDVRLGAHQSVGTVGAALAAIRELGVRNSFTECVKDGEEQLISPSKNDAQHYDELYQSWLLYAFNSDHKG